MIHLTETGRNAGRTLCTAILTETSQFAHAVYYPRDNPELRALVCPDCLKVWALEAYAEGDDMPEWVRELREDRT